MDRRLVPLPTDQPSAFLQLGSGWQWPAATLAALIAFFYLPAHHPASPDLDVPLAVVASLYLVFLSVAAPRIIRGLILRAGGGHAPVLLVGNGPDPLTERTPRARWRLLAIVAGTTVSIGAAIGAAQLAIVADPASYPHALADLAFGANVVVAAGVLVPAPGFLGWAMVLALVDACGVHPNRRAWQASRVTRLVLVPGVLLASTVAAILGEPLLVVPALTLALIAWTQAAVAAGQEALTGFLVTHLAGEIARPVVSQIDAAQSVADLLGPADGPRTVALVAENGAVVGAIGPRELGNAMTVARTDRCRDLMVPIETLSLIHPDAAAAEVLPEMARHGFALVKAHEGLGYVEPADLGGQVRIWIALAERGRSASQAGRRGRRGLGSITAERGHLASAPPRDPVP